MAFLTISSGLQTWHAVWYRSGTAPEGQAWQMPSRAISFSGQVVHIVCSILVTFPLGHAVQSVLNRLGTSPLGQVWQTPLITISLGLQGTHIVFSSFRTSPTGQGSQMPALINSFVLQAVITIFGAF